MQGRARKSLQTKLKLNLEKDKMIRNCERFIITNEIEVSYLAPVETVLFLLSGSPSGA